MRLGIPGERRRATSSGLRLKDLQKLTEFLHAELLALEMRKKSVQGRPSENRVEFGIHTRGGCDGRTRESRQSCEAGRGHDRLLHSLRVRPDILCCAHVPYNST